MRDRIEAALGRWGHFVYRRAIWVILCCVLFVGALGTQIQHFRLDASNEGYFHEDDPIRVRYDAFREVYGRESLILVALRPRDGVFEADFLETLRTLHEEIEAEVPLLTEVTSLVNARDTRGYDDRLDVGDLLEDWPETPESLEEVADRARANPVYRNYLLSGDGAITTIAIETQAYVVDDELDSLAGFDDQAEAESEGGERLLNGEDDARIAKALRAVVDRHRSEELELFVSGTPVFSSTLATRMETDMARFTALSIAVIVIFLGALFRRVGGVILPVVVVAVTVFSTLSLMGATRIAMMPPTQIIPSFLLAVGVGGTVHLLAIFYQARRRGDDEEAAVAHALAHSGLPIIMASLTTAGGLLSFAPAALRPTSHFGLFTPVGVILSLIFTLTLLPALMAILPMRVAEARSEDTLSQRLLQRVGAFSTRRPGFVALTWGLLIVVAAFGCTRLVLGHHMLEWFPHDDPMYQSTQLLNTELGGSVAYEVVISTGRENGFHDPDLLTRLDRVQREIENIEVSGLQAGKTLSLTDVVKETHKALNANQPAFYVIPDERTLVAQELLLFENAGSDDIEDFVDPQFTSGRLTVRIPFVDAARYVPYLEIVLPRIQGILGADYEVEITGMFRLLANTVTAALETMVTSYITAFIVITILMVMLIGRVDMGLVSMIPNLSPIILTLGLMGWLGIPLDMFTLMIGTIAIGLAVDDTIHFMHNFRRYYDESGDTEIAVRQTLSGTGQAMLFTTLVLGSGFLVYTQAYMVHLWGFGLLIATAIALAFIADVTLAPALVTLLWRRRQPARAG